MPVKKKYATLAPKYMKEFHCIGSACEDTCCAEWRVAIDKNTYKKYNNCRDSEMKKRMDENIKRNRNDPSDANYAYIKMDEDLYCPFLNENKLCSLQLKLGEDYLSNTCNVYPREYNIVNRRVEKSCTVSCPEVVRVALLNPDVMEFEVNEEDVALEGICRKVINTEDPDFQSSPIKYFQELRIFTINLLQAREYKLWERLVIMGIFYQTIQEYIQGNKIDEIPNLIDEYIIAIEKGAFDENLKSIPSNETVQIDLLEHIVKNRVSKGMTFKRYTECFNEFTGGLVQEQGQLHKDQVNNYKEAYKKYYQPFMEKHEYILENYLVNYVFKNLFPFTAKPDLFENYIMLIVYYSMMKMHLIGMSAFYKEEFRIEHVVKLIQTFSRAMEHTSEFIDITLDFLKEGGYTNLSYMLLLIKN